MEFKLAPEGIKLRDIDIWDDFYDSMQRGTPMEAVIMGTMRPPEEAEYWELSFKNKPGILGICPAAESGLPEKTPMNDFAGQVIVCLVNRIEKNNSAVVCSRKDIVENNRNRLLNQLTEGETINAVVRAVNWHVYVDIGGGVIIRIPEARARLSDGVPLTIQYSEGDIISVIVSKLDKEEKSIELEPADPWEQHQYNRGDVISGQVVQIRDNLAFVNVKSGIIGRVYYKSTDSYSEGDYIKLQVMDYNQEFRRLHLIAYDPRQIFDKRRERARRARKRAQKSQEQLTGPGNEIKTLGGFNNTPADESNREVIHDD